MKLMEKYNKTQKFLFILQTISLTPSGEIHREKMESIFKEKFGMSTSSFYRLIEELTTDAADIKAPLKETKRDNQRYFTINRDAYGQYAESNKDIFFMMEVFKKSGFLFNEFANGIELFENLEETTDKNIDRKFFYLSKFKGKALSPEHEKFKASLIRSILNEFQVVLHYKDDSFAFMPLTITTYRDDLYVIGYKHGEIDNENLRSLKLCRITKLFETKNKFKYPALSKYNPQEIYKETSGLIRGDVQKAKIKFYGYAKDALKEKHLYSNKLLEDHKEYDLYEMSFTNINEFLGGLMRYCDEIEIVSPAKLKDAFNEKLTKALKGFPGKTNKKKAS